MNSNQLKIEAATELKHILSYWAQHTIDENHGGFIGQIDHNNQPHENADKGSVLHARILWTFSAAVDYEYNEQYRIVADRAFNYINEYLIDRIYGGVYWTVSADGQPQHDKKQVYAQAFTIYALSEYYKVSNNEDALALAIVLFELIEHYTLDKTHGGYFEAFSREWSELKDLRLSAKDANEKKTMNTHLHIIEAYANLYSIAPTDSLLKAIRNLLLLFRDKIIDPDSGHLNLFFTETWEDRTHEISFGHDIEASWLLQECAEIIEDESLIKDFKRLAIKMVNASLEGLNEDHSLSYEYFKQEKRLVDERHWWVQSEAVVGFINAWQITRNDAYLQHASQTWNYIKDAIIDREHGEWYWGRFGDGLLMEEDKVGVWKCPYHNGRTCLEMMKRLS